MQIQLSKNRKIAIIILIIIVAMTITLGAMYKGVFETTTLIPENGITIHSTGLMMSIGLRAYEDSNLTIEMTSIDWGIFIPGQSKTTIAYIQNVGNVPITLVMDTQDWLPIEILSYMTLTWDYNGTTLGLLESTQVEFRLTIDYAIVGIESFSFNIILVGKNDV